MRWTPGSPLAQFTSISLSIELFNGACYVKTIYPGWIATTRWREEILAFEVGKHGRRCRIRPTAPSGVRPGREAMLRRVLPHDLSLFKTAERLDIGNGIVTSIGTVYGSNLSRANRVDNYNFGSPLRRPTVHAYSTRHTHLQHQRGGSLCMYLTSKMESSIGLHAYVQDGVLPGSNDNRSRIMSNSSKRGSLLQYHRCIGDRAHDPCHHYALYISLRERYFLKLHSAILQLYCTGSGSTEREIRTLFR